jgi:hypothetical protein
MLKRKGIKYKQKKFFSAYASQRQKKITSLATPAVLLLSKSVGPPCFVTFEQREPAALPLTL